jgi:predicted glycoside hydrolase/deacetylase ChbG (UPF0249 family)
MKLRTGHMGIALIGLLLSLPATAQQNTPEVMLRLDDVGMNHAINSAIKRVAQIGIPFSVSVLFVAPAYQEAVEILRANPHISVGIHLALNSEWRGYRWGPVLGKEAVPTLVDSVGYFVHSSREFLARPYNLAEVERELAAQIERAMRSGLRIDYVDYHMGTAVSTPELRSVVERLAARYRLGISRYFNEAGRELWGVAIEAKQDSLLAQISTAESGRPNLIVVHVAEATPEMNVLFDMNAEQMNTPAGEPLSGKHRQAELDALLSPEFSAAVRQRGVRLVTYRDLIARRGLQVMQRPITD